MADARTGSISLEPITEQTSTRRFVEISAAARGVESRWGADLRGLFAPVR